MFKPNFSEHDEIWDGTGSECSPPWLRAWTRWL